MHFSSVKKLEALCYDRAPQFRIDVTNKFLVQLLQNGPTRRG